METERMKIFIDSADINEIKEANTLGVKCSDIKVSSLVIEMKAEREKLREQIQNIE